MCVYLLKFFPGTHYNENNSTKIVRKREESQEGNFDELLREDWQNL